MEDLIHSSAFQALLSVVSLLVVIFVAYRVIEAIRPSTSKDPMSDQDLASDFEEMQRGGDINTEELRSIRAVLGKTARDRHSGSE